MASPIIQAGGPPKSVSPPVEDEDFPTLAPPTIQFTPPAEDDDGSPMAPAPLPLPRPEPLNPSEGESEDDKPNELPEPKVEKETNAGSNSVELPSSPPPVMTFPGSSNQPATSSPMVNDDRLQPRAAPSLTIEMLVPEAAGVDLPFSYEIVVRNVGNVAAHNVTVRQPVPPEVKLLKAEPACETETDSLVWKLNKLDAGDEKRLSVHVKPGSEGTVVSRAELSFTTAVQSTWKVTRPQVAVAINGPKTVRIGEKTTFEIRLNNTGTGPARKLLIQANFSDGLKHPHGELIEAEIQNLGNGQSKTLTIDATAVRSGAQSCSIVVVADANSPESAKAELSVVEPLLTIKQEGPSRCLVRSEPVYEIHLSNPGTAETEPVSVWTTVPNGFEFVSASDNGKQADDGTVSWKLPTLAAGANRTLTLKLRSSTAMEGTIRTMAKAGTPTASSDNGLISAGHSTDTAVKPLEVAAETPVVAEGVPALRFEVIDLEDPVPVGQEAVYEIKVMNQGTGACNNVKVVAELTDGTVAVGASGPTKGRAGNGQVHFDPIPTLGVKGEVTYTVRVRGDKSGDKRFRVRVQSDEIRDPITKEENTRFYQQ